MMKVILVLLMSVYFTFSQWTKEMENDDLFEGDMVLNARQKRMLQNDAYGALKRGGRFGRLFPRSYFLYKFGPKLAKNSAAVKEIVKGMMGIQNYTCLTFYPYNMSDFHMEYLYFYEGKGCSAPVGFQGSGKRHAISLTKGCFYFVTVMHVIMHTLGFVHEQSRPDRDDYVTVNFAYILRSQWMNFRKLSNKTIDSLGSPYDYRSIMHYSWDAWAIPPEPRKTITIKTKDPLQQYEIGQRAHLSYNDQWQINQLYHCVKPVPTIEPRFIKLNPNCQNRYFDCNRLAYVGMCWHSNMKLYCKRACNLCTKANKVIHD